MRVSTIVILTLLLSGGITCREEHKRNPLFQSLPASRTGIGFVNKVEENDLYNVMNYMNIYTGAGVAAGDINNDGLTDLFFSGNQVSCRLYINKGDLQFEDVTEKAGLTTDRWCTGVSMADINQDGFSDIYINVAGSSKFGSTANLLYINNRNGTFTEKAREYGIADTRLIMNASFFDYDRDGDLDLFLITDPADGRVDDVNTALRISRNGESEGTDILYRNNGNETFTDVSREAGILMEGYSLAAGISDLNNDGWPDIYVSNDFLTNDILYINNRNGTFTDRLTQCMKHTSYSSMGNDVVDFNNDGLPDVFTLDMLPEDNYRRKMIVPAASYDKFQLLVGKGYEPQYTRNALQLNNGLLPSIEGAQPEVSFSDIAFLAGVSATDWSWASLFADYDNDGDKDLMVTNGFYRDFGDQDFIFYQSQSNYTVGNVNAQRAQKQKEVSELPKVPLLDYLFENNGDLSFTKRSEDWGFNEPGFSSGACYADLDNDGDLELVINQFNSPARLFRNNTSEEGKSHFLSIRLKGKAPNLQAIGAKVYVFTGNKMQLQELNPYRGYESTVDLPLHFGLGKNAMADSVRIIWPDGKREVKFNVQASALTIEYAVNEILAIPASFTHTVAVEPSPLFTNITEQKKISYTHEESYFIDYNIQRLLPHMNSRSGPGIAVGDVNGDGLEDFYAGASAKKEGVFFLQQANGVFSEKKLAKDALYEDMGVLLFDADNDKDLDLYIVSGSSENDEGSSEQQDRLYINDGKGNYSLQVGALPDTRASGSCVAGCDYDKDGDIDLFVGGRVVPGNYPATPESYLLKNNGGQFSNASKGELPDQGKIGMVTSAIWTDIDNDGWTDLMLAGEFIPIQVIKNKNGLLDYRSPITIKDSKGWWNSITSGDFDEDGDIDYLLGNLGLNTRYKATPKEPLCIYAKDFNGDGRIDPVMCYYVQGQNEVYPVRDELIGQMISMRRKFPTYKQYASAAFNDIFSSDDLKDALVVKAECFESSYLENKGNGVFEKKALPIACQFAPVFGMVSSDFDRDGHLDVLLTGNFYSGEVSTGNYDAMTGLLLLGDGKGNFKAISSSSTGFLADRDSKGMALISMADNSEAVLVANNNDKLQVYGLMKKGEKTVAPKPEDVSAIVYKTDGTAYRQELGWGTGYLSASSRLIRYGGLTNKITLINNKGGKNDLLFNDKIESKHAKKKD